MTVATKLQPNFTTQSASVYKAAIDGITAVHDRIAGAFAPHEMDIGSPAPDLAVRIDAGYIFSNATLTEIAAQTVTGFTVPTAGQHRYDRVVIDSTTGAASRVAGTAATGSPTAALPAIPAGKLPCCTVLLTSSTPVITNSMITDERIPFGNQVSASPITNALAADVDLNNTANYFTGPSVAQGSTGTWFASGSVTLLDTTSGAFFDIKLWDGTTVIQSGKFETPSLNRPVSVTLSGYIENPAGNIRISVRDLTNTTGKIKFNSSGESKDSTVSAFRIA